jgi:hypothetical protein
MRNFDFLSVQDSPDDLRWPQRVANAFEGILPRGESGSSKMPRFRANIIPAHFDRSGQKARKSRENFFPHAPVKQIGRGETGNSEIRKHGNSGRGAGPWRVREWESGEYGYSGTVHWSPVTRRRGALTAVSCRSEGLSPSCENPSASAGAVDEFGCACPSQPPCSPPSPYRFQALPTCAGCRCPGRLHQDEKGQCRMALEGDCERPTPRSPCLELPPIVLQPVPSPG